MTTRFEVRRNALRETRWAETPSAPLEDGQVRLHVDVFALTSNNITYAAMGDALNYWAFYPTGDPTTGCVPVWGFADVVESHCGGVEPGERFYGYWPIADEVVLAPTDVGPGGFSESAPHRRELPPFYNRYARCSADPGYRADGEAQQALLRGQFGTGFLLDDFFADSDFFGARTVVLSSASSKTAYSAAFCLAQRRDSAVGVRVIGLTSPGNLDFVTSLGCYDHALTYGEVATALPEEPSVYIDFSGSSAVRAAVHQRLADRLKYSCAVGATHWDAPAGDTEPLPGPAPTLFFAPSQIEKRIADWGPAGLQQRVAASWAAFIEPVTRAENPWLTVVRGTGPAAVEATYTALLDGTVPANEGHILSV